MTERFVEPAFDPPAPRWGPRRVRWWFRRRNPMKIRPYLAEANYYRLAYHLAAQRINAVLDPKTDTGPPERRPALLREALRPAEEVASDSARVLAWFDRRVLWLRAHGPDSDSSRRLYSFLSDTVVPCTELLRAGVLIELGSRDEAERLAGPVRDRDSYALTHRTLYDLACYEAQLFAHVRDAETADRAIDALRDALGRIHGSKRAELVRWAGTDPSFAAARAEGGFERRFTALLALYPERTPAPDPGAQTTQPAPRRRRRGGALRRLLRAIADPG